MKKLVILFSSCFFPFLLFAQSGSIDGTVTDEHNEPLINAIVVVTNGSVQQGSVVTDFDGNYSVKPLAASRYEATVKFAGYRKDSVFEIIVRAEGDSRLNFKLERLPTAAPQNEVSGKRMLQAIGEAPVRATRYVRPPKEGNGTRRVLTADEIEKMPMRNALEYSLNRGCSPYPSGGLNICGRQGENTLYVIDGIVQVGSRESGHAQEKADAPGNTPGAAWAAEALAPFVKSAVNVHKHCEEGGCASRSLSRISAWCCRWAHGKDAEGYRAEFLRLVKMVPGGWCVAAVMRAFHPLGFLTASAEWQ